MNKVAYQDPCVLLLRRGCVYPVHACGFFAVVGVSLYLAEEYHALRVFPQPSEQTVFLKACLRLCEHFLCDSEVLEIFSWTSVALKEGLQLGCVLGSCVVYP